MSRLSLSREDARSLAGERPFVRLVVAQLAGIAGIYGLGLAGVAFVESRTQSTAQTGLVIASSILPAFLASLVAGAVVDRWGRVRSLMAAYLGRVVVGLAFWGGTALLPTGPALAAVYLANAGGAMLAQFAMSAELSLVPRLVREERLMGANALLQLGMLAGEGLGVVAIAPLAVKVAGAPAMGVVSAALCALGVALVVPLLRADPAPTVAAAPAGRSPWANLTGDLQAGWRVISRDRLLALVTVQATLAAALLLVLLSLVPGMAARHLGLAAEDTPFLILPGGLGFVAGAALMSRWQGRLSRPGWIAAGLVGVGLGCGLLALALSSAGGAPALALALGAVITVGLSLALVIIPARVVLQERPPAAVRGRVIAAQLALANAAAVVPLVVGGALADTFGIGPVMAVLGLLALGSSGLGLWGGFR